MSTKLVLLFASLGLSLGSAETFLPSDCGLPGDVAYSTCQSLFPNLPTPALPDVKDLGEIPGFPNQFHRPFEGSLYTYTVGAISHDGQYVAVDIQDGDTDHTVHVWHGGYSGSLMDTFAPDENIIKINNQGVILGGGDCTHLGYGNGNSYVTSIGCFETDVPDKAAGASGVDGGIGTFLDLNDSGQVFMRGGKFDYTLLTPLDMPVTATPEPAAIWLLGAGLVVLARKAGGKT
jgi:hypothetical protein